jgi:hypothetical protein
MTPRLKKNRTVACSVSGNKLKKHESVFRETQEADGGKSSTPPRAPKDKSVIMRCEAADPDSKNVEVPRKTGGSSPLDRILKSGNQKMIFKQKDSDIKS